jgi:hypothetical protein
MRKVSFSVSEAAYRSLIEAQLASFQANPAEPAPSLSSLVDRALLDVYGEVVVDLGAGERLDTPAELREGERRATREEVEAVHGPAVADTWERQG